ncbi:MAG TPA: EamA family transporter RarD [Sporichthya sp.]|nr:EamA family transporter RarD [Sporichthya sp.]
MTTDRRGFVYGVWAYALWGLLPLYWPHLEPAGAPEVLAHRVIWSSLFAALMVWLLARRGGAALEGLRALRTDRRQLRLLTAAGVLIGANWLIYIWAVNHDHVVETALGYYINPLMTITVAVLVLGEQLRAPQWSAIGIAGAGVVVLTIGYGRLPWIALCLAVSFAAYSLIKKTVGVGALEGLTVETAVLLPPALIFLAVLTAGGDAEFGHHGAGHALLMSCAGLATLAPLLLFAGAARRVSLSTLGMLQYLAPTLQFLIGVLINHEPLPPERLAGFALVWTALVVLTVDGVHHQRRTLRIATQAPV